MKNILLCAVVLLSMSAFAVDGVVLINQASVMSAGGFPYKITQSGSYRLSGNLTPPANTDGIDIAADNVTLDLNGFAIAGLVTCDGAPTSTTTTCTGANVFNGIGVNSAGNNVTVRNGTVRGMTEGIELQGDGSFVEEVHVFNNGENGIMLDAAGVVRRCTATHNGNVGILASTAVITQNLAFGNGNDGISGLSSTISDNTVSRNAGSAGIVATFSKVTDNTSTFNSGFGLLISGGLYGSNSLTGNSAGTVGLEAPAVSQKNNNCGGIVC